MHFNVLLESIQQDIRYAFRTLKSSPLITAAAIVALALGIGANVTVFTLVSSALRFDMGVEHVERMVVLHSGGVRLDPAGPAPLDVLNLRSQLTSIEHIAAYHFAAVNLSDSHALPERLRSVQMTASGWAMVRQKPILGRAFGPADERVDATSTVMLTHQVWERRYRGDPAILGKAVRIDNVDHVVIGVMPPGAQFPEDTDLWTPLTAADLVNPAVNRSLLVFGWLAPNATLSAAQSEADGVVRRTFAGTINGPAVQVGPMLEIIGIYQTRPILIAMVFAVAFVLLIVCGDVANLLLARAATRVREISIRIAIGAGRARIVRQLLIESASLSAAGGFGGWIIAMAGLRWFDRLSAQGQRPSWIHFSMDGYSFVYFAAISIGSGILFGLAPALQLMKVDVNSAIKDGGRGAEGPRNRKLAGLMVGFQMALCVVLLAASGLMIHSAVNLYATALAVDPANVLTMRLDLPLSKYPTPAGIDDFYRRLESTLAALPGVTHVSTASHLPMLGSLPFRAEVEGTTGHDTRSGEIAAVSTDADYFQTLSVRLLRGSGFERAHDSTQVVVNESFAEQFWPGEDPIGRRIRPEGRQWLTVTGVVGDVQQDLLRPLERRPLVYLPIEGTSLSSVFLIAKTAISPANLVEPVRHAVQSLDEDLPTQDIATLDERVSRRRLNVSVFGALFTVLAAIALLLAWVGLYAVVAHAVTRRTQEIGIRMAMGGTKRDIFRLVLRQGMMQVLGGFAAGLPLALLVTRALSNGLIGVSPSDPATYLSVSLVLGLAGLLGCAIPARKALSVDPLTALRHE